MTVRRSIYAMNEYAAEVLAESIVTSRIYCDHDGAAFRVPSL
jgi:hypothetical protein